MQGYDREAALRYISKKVDPSAHKAFSPREVESLLRKDQELDLQYMEEAGVLVDGVAGDSFYDGDEAFEYISAQALWRRRGDRRADPRPGGRLHGPAGGVPRAGRPRHLGVSGKKAGRGLEASRPRPAFLCAP